MRQHSIAAAEAIFSEPNIEFSCPAASTQHYMELPGCIHRSIRPLRGQLQRFVTPPVFSTSATTIGLGSSLPFSSQPSKRFCNFRFRAFPFGNFNHHLIKFSLWVINAYAIQVKENERSSQCSSFVSINKGMVLTNVKCICCCLFVFIMMQKLAFKRGRRHCQSGAQQPRVTKSVATTISSDLILQNQQRFGHGEESGVQGLLSKLSQHRSMPVVYSFERFQNS